MKNPILFPIIPIIPILIALLLLSCNKDDQLSPDLGSITTSAELTAALTDIHKDTDAPGFAVSVVKNDVLIYQESFGKADLKSNKAYTNQTTQPIGSISKTFVAAAVVKAIEQGHFTLETDINDILPFEVNNPKQPNATIKIKHLVTHTSGLLDDGEVYFQAYHILPGESLASAGAQLLLHGFGFQQRATMPLEEFLAGYYIEEGDKYHEDNFASTIPGATWQYSNIATSLAAYLVETATGTPFKEYVQTNILQPLGMAQTAYEMAELNPEDAAKLYWNKLTPFPNYFNDSYPDGSLITCNEDFAKYLMDMMKGAKGQSTTLFSASGYEMLFDALLPDDKVPAGFGENQGIFWFLDGNTIKHDGSDPGTTCNLQFDKNGHSGYLLMTNMDATTDEHTMTYFELAEKVQNAVTGFIQNN